MQIYSVSDQRFRPYGKVLQELELQPLLEVLQATPQPDDGVVYVASDSTLEALPLLEALTQRVYGGMPIQIGYCNGNNTALNCLEYHRGSEVCIAASEVILLVAPLQKLQDNRIDSGVVEAFRVPAGTAVLTYETTLHYAPCNGGGGGFRTAIVLPRGTNEAKPQVAAPTPEDALLWGRNKWLIAHPDSLEAAQGAVAGITGENLRTIG